MVNYDRAYCSVRRSVIADRIDVFSIPSRGHKSTRSVAELLKHNYSGDISNEKSSDSSMDSLDSRVLE